MNLDPDAELAEVDRVGDLNRDRTSPRVLTHRQPWVDLLLDGTADVLNVPYAPPEDLPVWMTCSACFADREPNELLANCGCYADDIPKFGGRWVPSSEDGFAHSTGRFPFEVWLHAAAARDTTPVARRTVPTRTPNDRVGVILGAVRVTGAHPASSCEGCSPWARPDGWHWQASDPKRLSTPLAARGRAGLWLAEHVLSVNLDRAPVQDQPTPPVTAGPVAAPAWDSAA